MGFRMLNKSYWGFDWKENLLNNEDKREFNKKLLKPKHEDLTSDKFERYSKILDNQIADERDRFSGIEAKALQIVGQVSIVTTIVGLFAPFILDKIPSEYPGTRILLIVGVLVIVLLFVYAIICALRNSELSKFWYAKSEDDTVLKHHLGEIKHLNYEIINDKIIELKSSMHSNNAKASNVIYAFRAFRAAMFALVIYMLVYSIVLFIVPESVQKVEVTPETIKEIRRQQQSVQQTIHIIIDSFTKKLEIAPVTTRIID